MKEKFIKLIMQVCNLSYNDYGDICFSDGLVMTTDEYDNVEISDTKIKTKDGCDFICDCITLWGDFEIDLSDNEGFVEPLYHFDEENLNIIINKINEEYNHSF